jgi:hypothetical protein
LLRDALRFLREALRVFLRDFLEKRPRSLRGRLEDLDFFVKRPLELRSIFILRVYKKLNVAV